MVSDKFVEMSIGRIAGDEIESLRSYITDMADSGMVLVSWLIPG